MFNKEMVITAAVTAVAVYALLVIDKKFIKQL
jgi:hypothetical protein